MSLAPAVTSVVPCTEGYPGDYSLKLNFPNVGMNNDAICRYSSALNQLFCQAHESCPVLIRVHGAPPDEAILRAFVIYKNKEHVAEVVEGCSLHETEEPLSNSDHRTLLLRIDDNSQAYYVKDANGRHSVCIPYERPQLGHECTVLLNYMCNSDCCGGINNRPIVTIITLETKEGLLLGRCCFEVKICSSPGQFCQKEEETNNAKRALLPVCDCTLPKKKKDDTDAESFHIVVKGYNNYKIMKKVIDALESQ